MRKTYWKCWILRKEYHSLSPVCGRHILLTLESWVPWTNLWGLGEGEGKDGGIRGPPPSLFLPKSMNNLYSCKPSNLKSPYGNSYFVIGLFYVTRSLLSWSLISVVDKFAASAFMFKLPFKDILLTFRMIPCFIRLLFYCWKGIAT